MLIDKTKIIDLLKQRGDDDKAAKAETDLPDQVDTEKHSDTLGKLGIDPGDLAGGVSGKLGL